MIAADRFIETSDNYEAWLEARRGGVTATSVANASTPAGFTDEVNQRLTPTPVVANEYMRFGSESEREIMRFVHREHGVLPSNWLIASESDKRFLATPDGLSPDHKQIAECKTTGADWDTIPLKYRRQVWWQLFVTGAESCVFAWQLRVPDDKGWFYLGWLEPKVVVIERDEKKIAELIGTAERLLEATNGW